MHRSINLAIVLLSLLPLLSFAPLAGAQQAAPNQAGVDADAGAVVAGPHMNLEVHFDPRMQRALQGVWRTYAGSVKTDRMKVALNVRMPSPLEGSVTIPVSSKLLPGVDEAAVRQSQREFVKALTDDLKREFDRFAKDAELSINRVRNQFDKAQVEAAKVDDELRAVRQKLRQLSGRIDVSPDGIAKAAAGLEQEAQRIAIDTAAQEARKKAMEEAIAKLSAQGQDQSKKDPIAVELAKILDARAREWELTQRLYKDGRLSAAEMTAVEAKVGEARIRLLEREEAISGGANTDAVKQFNRELLTLSVNLTEQQARREAVAKMLNRFAEASELLDASEQFDRRRRDAHQRLEESRARLRQLEENDLAGLRPPTVTTLGMPENAGN